MRTNQRRRPFGLTWLDLASAVVAFAAITFTLATVGFYVCDAILHAQAAVAENAAVDAADADVGDAIRREMRAEFAKAEGKWKTDVSTRSTVVQTAVDQIATIEEKLRVDLECIQAAQEFNDAQKAERAALATSAEWEKKIVARKNRQREAALGLLVVGQMVEGMGKAQAPGFTASFLRQYGVQLQVCALTSQGAHSDNPVVAMAEGFLLGL